MMLWEENSERRVFTRTNKLLIGELELYEDLGFLFSTGGL